MEKIKNFIRTGKDRKPLCPYCKVEYPDACYGEVKNYPDDGGLAVFMTCEDCGKEAETFFNWKNSKI